MKSPLFYLLMYAVSKISQYTYAIIIGLENSNGKALRYQTFSQDAVPQTHSITSQNAMQVLVFIESHPWLSSAFSRMCICHRLTTESLIGLASDQYTRHIYTYPLTRDIYRLAADSKGALPLVFFCNAGDLCDWIPSQAIGKQICRAMCVYTKDYTSFEMHKFFLQNNCIYI